MPKAPYTWSTRDGLCDADGELAKAVPPEDWWEIALAEYKESGRRDAEVGRYTPPHLGDEDPTDIAENSAYKEGFMERRLELGKMFKWA